MADDPAQNVLGVFKAVGDDPASYMIAKGCCIEEIQDCGGGYAKLTCFKDDRSRMEVVIELLLCYRGAKADGLTLLVDNVV